MFKTIKNFLDYRKREKRESSSKPYFDFEILELTDDGIQAEMDWNPAFIKKLRDMGYPGISDEEVIEGYLHKIFEKAYMKNVMDETLMRQSAE